MEAAPILRIDNIFALLTQLVTPQGAPHTALLIARHGGAVLVSHTLPTAPPFPPASLADRDDDERARIYAAVACSGWEGEEQEDTSESLKREPFLIQSDLGRICCVGVGAFLLVLVGTSVSPWPVLDKKTRLAEEMLHDGLKQSN